MSQTSVSLCVATRGNEAVLQSLLNRLQPLGQGRPWELILVCNSIAPPDPAKLLLDAGAMPVRLLHEPVRGKSRALNRAMDAATGDLIVFSDDDIEYPPDWLERLVNAADNNVWATVLGGRILARGPVPDWIRRSSNLQSALLCEHDLGTESRPYPNGLYPFGPNLAVRRQAIVQANARWPEAMGPGSRLPVGDEFGFLAQISPPNHADRLYVADAVVYHEPQPLYFGTAGAIRRVFQVGLAAGSLDAKFGPIHREPAARRALARASGLRSPRELICVLTRAFGVLLGRLLRPG